jgi:pimeloyl-ACP methyl ester carboxylesterase
MSPGTPSPSSHHEDRMGNNPIYVEHHGPTTHPAVILVHGAPDRSAAFRGVFPHLGDHHVIVYDRRGYGRSVGAAPAEGMVDHAKDLLEIAEGLPTAPIVVAHSFGANPTMLAATLRPNRFAALGLWEPPLPWVDWWSENTKAYNAGIAASNKPDDEIEAISRALLGDAAWGRLRPEVRAQRRAEGAAFQADMASELSAPFDFGDVRVPALVGFGTNTSSEHAHGARWLAEALPDAGLQSISGAGHFAHRTHPEAFAVFVRSVALLSGGVRSTGHR